MLPQNQDLIRPNRALYLRGDPYEASDAVFGVKESLVVDLQEVDSEIARKYDVQKGSLLLTYDFVLVTSEESGRLRDENALLAMHKLGKKVKLLSHLPVPDLD